MKLKNLKNLNFVSIIFHSLIPLFLRPDPAQCHLLVYRGPISSGGRRVNCIFNPCASFTPYSSGSKNEWLNMVDGFMTTRINRQKMTGRHGVLSLILPEPVPIRRDKNAKANSLAYLTTNPCRYGSPATALKTSSRGKVWDEKTAEEERIYCNERNRHICPNGYYCHIGGGFETNVCCRSSGAASPCTLSLNLGQGGAALKRYYYDSQSGKCLRFSYGGLRGNENNFLNFEDCLAICNPTGENVQPAQKNNDPCPIGQKMLMTNENSPQFCSRSNLCPDQYWCHVGPSPETTVCCLAAANSTNPCELPVREGRGNYPLKRWYFDFATTKKCRPFIYLGQGGGENMFISERDCKLACFNSTKYSSYYYYKNPCSNGSPLVNGDGDGDSSESIIIGKIVGAKNPNQLWMQNREFFRQRNNNNNNNANDISIMPVIPRRCTRENPCPATHYCHMGADFTQLNFCCPQDGDPCTAEKEPGSGSHSLKRYFYDTIAKRCREFRYRGRKGNANNFLTIEDCQLTCPEAHPNPCQNGSEPLMFADKSKEEEKSRLICGGAQKCPKGYWCHVGKSPELTNCCPVTNESEQPCDMQLERGRGGDRLERWYFDSLTHTCKKFTYRGLAGNRNNFISRNQCQLVCNDTRWFCNQPPDIGPCRNYQTRYVYLSATDTCTPFRYGGCAGNLNNFKTLQQCRQICSVKTL